MNGLHGDDLAALLRAINMTDAPLSVNLVLDAQSTAKVLDLIRETMESTLRKRQPLTPASAGPLPPGRDMTAADLRTALLLGKIPDTAGLMVDTKTFAMLLNISSRHLIRLRDLKALPEPIRLGQLVRWRLAEVLEWIEADCPPQRVWVQKRKRGD
jgi:predicted DNA-binding transcriptional regulator AlpA